MKYIVSNIKTGLNESPDLPGIKAAKKLGVKSDVIKNCRIIKESIDSRKKDNINLVYSVLVETAENIKIRNLHDVKIAESNKVSDIVPGNAEIKNRPVIIGSGPAGLFAGLLLADYGYKPLILERGDTVENRTAAVNKYWETGILDIESNVQFGEGGAGTFSDGKLTTRINDPRCDKVLDIFRECGVPEDVLYKAKPHIGTDKLKDVLVKIRKRIENQGGEIRFRSKADQFIIKDNKISEIVLNNGDKISCDIVILAIGHSARDTFKSLLESGLNIVQKPFSAGLRIEHPQDLINRIQHGKYAGHPRLGSAEYSLFCRNGERTAYTFCMCPGGLVVAAASEENTIVTNGMSEFARNRSNANAAFVVSVNTEDFGSSHPLAGIEFQRNMEKMAFKNAGANGSAPVQLLGDFIDGKTSRKWGSVNPSYTGNVDFSDLNNCMPDFISVRLKEAAYSFDRKMKGFYLPDAVLTGVETRTSSPVRILRDETCQALGMTGIYPAGEGAGYAGGIMSAAVDGLRIAQEIISKFSPKY